MVRDFETFQAYLRKNQLLEQFGLNRIGVFGSFSRGENYNDIDLLIEDEISFYSLLNFKQKLENDLQLPIDIMIKKYAEPIILLRALRDIKYATKQ